MRPSWSWCVLFVIFPALCTPRGECSSPAGSAPQARPKWDPSPHIATSEPLRPEQQVKKFRLPPGFEVQLVAADPDIRKPINIAFDAAGRLWLTETIEYPFPAAPGKGRDAVKILDDFAPDGRARKITTYAGGLNIPIGVLPLTTHDALFYSIPSIYTSNGTDRKVLFTGYGFGDTHGMTGEFVRGFDGWVYACHGYANTSVVKDASGKPTITMTSGNTYRFTTDGRKIEYFTHGQVNPFGLCFDPRGNLYSADCHTQPIYQLLRGAWYPSFGRPHDGLDFAPETITHYPESTAIAGIAYYAADQYPPAFRDCCFIGDVVTNRVNLFRLAWHGSTPKATLERFVQSDDPWFRPVDVKLGPDGCLYVADFYNRLIGHYEVPLNHPGRDRDKGRIWRIVYRGPNGNERPKRYDDLTKLDGQSLMHVLDNPNLAVRLHATDELVRRGVESIYLMQALLANGSAVQKVHALWVLHRQPGPYKHIDLPILTAASKDRDALVRVHAQRIMTEREKLSPAERELVLAGLNDAGALVTRCAAEALGAHPEPANLAPLLELRRRVPPEDSHLLHVVRMALRDQLRGEPSIPAFALVGQLSEPDQRAIAEVCPGVHNEPAAQFLLGFIKRAGSTSDELKRYTHTVVRYGQPAVVSEIAGLIAARFQGDLMGQAAVLKTVQQATQERGAAVGKKERDFADHVANALLASANAKDVQSGIELAGAFKLVSAQPALLGLAKSPAASDAVRKTAVSTAVTIDPAGAVKALSEVMLNDAEALPVREQAATALASTNRPEAHAALVKVMEAAPARLQTVIALGLAGSPQGGEKLLDAVGKGKASPRLVQDRAVELKLRQARIAGLNERLAKLTKGLPAADQRIAAIIAQRRDGFLGTTTDASAGFKVYEKHCAACHQLAGKGAKVGPQLDGIGIRGIDRLLEDVLDPNRNVDQAFRSTTLVLDNGQLVSGLLLREEGEVMVVADSQGKEQRVPKGSVAERIVSQLSPMPSNFAEQIGERDLYDLLAYLLRQRAKE
jgi:putative heme-binding domain-containing protein